MRRLLALAATAAVLATPLAANAYDRTCGGMVDMECNGTVCPMDCFARECYLWLDLLHNRTTAQCVRPIIAD